MSIWILGLAFVGLLVGLFNFGAMFTSLKYKDYPQAALNFSIGLTLVLIYCANLVAYYAGG